MLKAVEDAAKAAKKAAEDAAKNAKDGNAAKLLDDLLKGKKGPGPGPG